MMISIFIFFLMGVLFVFVMDFAIAISGKIFDRSLNLRQHDTDSCRQTEKRPHEQMVDPFCEEKPLIDLSEPDLT